MNANHQQKHYELYRYTTIGTTLQEVLTDLIQTDKLPRNVENDILEIFDNVVSDAMFPAVKNRVSFHGHLNSYRFCENVWTLFFDNFELREGQGSHRAHHMKVVACDGRTSRPRTRKRNKKSKKRKKTNNEV
ncbi:hypothetical protein ACOME3_005390 [Neoechinorhynchus agilis]